MTDKCAKINEMVKCLTRNINININMDGGHDIPEFT